jgi:hypothetical protein
MSMAALQNNPAAHSWWLQHFRWGLAWFPASVILRMERAATSSQQLSAALESHLGEPGSRVSRPEKIVESTA